MNGSEATVSDLSGLLPALDELEPFRSLLVSASVPDPDRQWDGSSAYTTVDMRIVGAGRLGAMLDEAEAAVHRHVSRVYGALRPALAAYVDGRPAEAARLLVELGEALEADGRAAHARRCYDVALALSLPLADRSAQILVLRRIARGALAGSDVQEALVHYQRSTELARDSADRRGEVIGLTGQGNALFWQGRWTEAERCYRAALACIEAGGGEVEAFRLERAQLLNNLGNVATRQGRLAEAAEHFEGALALLGEADTHDLALCYINQGHLLVTQARHAEARERYQAALLLPVPLSVHAGIAIDMASTHMEEGHLSEAERWSRQAEEHALASQSPYILAFMYQGRGNLARARGDDDGFTFYEKALEIARAHGFPYVEAETLVDYAGLRLQTGGVEEAQAYLERASEIFDQLGAARDRERAQGMLAELAAGGRLLSAAD